MGGTPSHVSHRCRRWSAALRRLRPQLRRDTSRLLAGRTRSGAPPAEPRKAAAPGPSLPGPPSRGGMRTPGLYRLPGRPARPSHARPAFVRTGRAGTAAATPRRSAAPTTGPPVTPEAAPCRPARTIRPSPAPGRWPGRAPRPRQGPSADRSPHRHAVRPAAHLDSQGERCAMSTAVPGRGQDARCDRSPTVSAAGAEPSSAPGAWAARSAGNGRTAQSHRAGRAARGEDVAARRRARGAEGEVTRLA